RRMAINLLGWRHAELARRFGGAPLPHEQRFGLADWGVLATGAPVLLDALAVFDCVVDEMMMAHSHAVLIGEIKSNPPRRDPMNARMIEIESRDGRGRFAAYLSLPPGGKGPGLVLAQEIFGVNATMREVADYYAEEGYVVLVPDLFWRQSPGVQLG
ncbi:hypothetical protein KXX11_004103, partial [Aspergillus fumigatus]